jgi:transposase
LSLHQPKPGGSIAALVENFISADRCEAAVEINGLTPGTPYSPDLNSIERFFARLKHGLRKAAQRTTELVYGAIAPILDTVSQAECAN